MTTNSKIMKIFALFLIFCGVSSPILAAAPPAVGKVENVILPPEANKPCKKIVADGKPANAYCNTSLVTNVVMTPNKDGTITVNAKCEQNFNGLGFDPNVKPPITVNLTFIFPGDWDATSIATCITQELGSVNMPNGDKYCLRDERNGLCLKIPAGNPLGKLLP